MNTDLFNSEFEAHRKQLRSYLLRMTVNVADAEDILQDTYLKGLDKLHTFRAESSLKTWLFAIASNLARDNRRVHKRWTEDVTDIARREALADADFLTQSIHIAQTSPQGTFEVKEHIAFCFTCISKSLPLEQQLCIFLKEVYEFAVAEIATILSLTEAMVKYYLHAARSKMTGIFDGRCALINKEGVCHQCSELNGKYNPLQNTQHELMKIELARQAGNTDKERLFDLRMAILKEIDPFESGGAALELHHLAFNNRVMDNYFEKNGFNPIVL